VDRENFIEARRISAVNFLDKDDELIGDVSIYVLLKLKFVPLSLFMQKAHKIRHQNFAR